VNRRKPRVQTPVVSRYPARAPIHDFVLLFLPPCGTHLTPLATGSLEPSILVSPLLGGPARHRPFVPTLHLHQRKSSRNLHLQYSANSQSTSCRQSLITARSDHPPVLGRSGPQSPPWWVHWQHTQVTNSEKREKEKKQLETQTGDQKLRKDHLSEKNLSPLRQGQRLDTTEIKCSKIVDSLRWGKRARHHQQKSTTKIQAKKSSQMHECKLPLNKCISPNFSSLDAKLPLETWIWYFPPPCW
jgi:hypothetical protein